MKIIILGAGRVGSTIAKRLEHEANDITLVDINATRLKELHDILDVGILHGFASHPAILESAGIATADILIAVTQSDEVNMLACMIAHTLYHNRALIKVARVRRQEYLTHEQLFTADALSIDAIINPELMVTNYIRQLIESPEIIKVINFADGLAKLVGVKVYPNSRLSGHPVKDIHSDLPGNRVRIPILFRGNDFLFPDGETVIHDHDEVYFVTDVEDTRTVIREFRQLDKPGYRIIIAGGGNIGKRLAQALDYDHDVKLIEYDRERCEAIAGDFTGSTIVLNGDAKDETLLKNESIEQTDMFLALTNFDETNILSSLMAKKLGVRKAIALVNKGDYIDLAEQSGLIDLALSPDQFTIGGILKHVRQRETVAVHPLRRNFAEAVEINIRGTAATNAAIGCKAGELPLLDGVTVAAVIRDNQLLTDFKDTVLADGDHIVLILADSQLAHQTTALFHPKGN